MVPAGRAPSLTGPPPGGPHVPATRPPASCRRGRRARGAGPRSRRRRRRPPDAQGNWVRIGDPNNPPLLTWNNNHQSVYDSLGDRILAYNLVNANASVPTGVAEIWEFRVGEPDSGWRLLPTFGDAPVGAAGASMLVDPATNRLLLYGGWRPYGGTMTNDVFVLPLTGPAVWTRLSPNPDTMRVRLDALFALDEATRTLVVQGGSAQFSDHYGPVSDAWTLSLDSTAAWVQVPVTNDPPPLRNYEQHAYDPARHRVLVHGGVTYSGIYGMRSDTWALSLDAPARWDSIAFTGPQLGRMYGDAIVDVAGDRLIVGPGTTSQSPMPPSDLDTYQLPLAPGGEWSVLPAAAPFAPPGYSYTYSAAFDRRRNRMITVGPLFTQSLALGDGSGWQRLWPPDPVRSPEALRDNVLVSDPAHQAIWSVGGTELCGFHGPWKLEATGDAQWTYLPQAAFPVMSGHAATLDAADNRVLVTWLDAEPGRVLSLGTDGAPALTTFLPSSGYPPNRVDHTAVVDPVRRRLLVFGGQIFLAHFNGYSYDDLWAAPLDTLGSWTQLSAGPGPSARGDHFAFYDDLQDRMVVFGGWQQSGGPIRHYQNDAWALSLAGAPAWSPITNGAAWIPPVSGSLTYDPVNHRLFLFSAADATPSYASSVWMRGIADGDTWQPLTTAGDQPGINGPIAFAPWCDRLVVTSTNRDGPQNDETWALGIDHAVPALASLESVEAAPDRVAIHWRVSGAPGALALARREDGGEWRDLATLLPDGEGRVSFEDRDVVPGQSLTYRLSGASGALAETRVLVPLRTPLAFSGARPSPARGAAHMAFALPADSPVRLELYDVRGARVLARELGLRPAGEHEWTWPETAALRPGLYLARLVTSAGARDAKVVLLP